MTDEEYVRSKWERVTPYGDQWILNSRGPFTLASARRFTENREEQIRQVEEEIDWLMGFSAYAGHSIYGPIRQRILVREQAVLAELKEGMKV